MTHHGSPAGETWVLTCERYGEKRSAYPLNMEVYKSKLKDSLGIEVYKRESQHLLYLSKRELKVIDEPFTESEINFCVQRSRLLLLLTHEVI